MAPKQTEHAGLKIIGHRGAAGLAPENTIPSFVRALEIGCRHLELDVHTARDLDTLVVIHDPTLDRTADLSGPVSDRTVEELARADAGGGAPVPTLQEVMDVIHRWQCERPEAPRITVNIELKGAATARHTARFIAESGQAHPGPDYVVSAFVHQALIDFRSYDETTPTAPLFDRWSSRWPDIAAQLRARSVNLSQRIATEKRVSAIHEAGYEVWCYTVNTRRGALRLKKMGVDGLFTDRPDRLIDYGSEDTPR